MRFCLCLLALGVAAAPPLHAARAWDIPSPQHEQTFAYGSEQSRTWVQFGNQLGIIMHFTNDPHVDKIESRQYDDFSFPFPEVTLGRDGRTFYYHPRGGAPVPVAAKHPGLFGDEIHLLPTAELVVEGPHGLLSLHLRVSDSAVVPEKD